MRRVTNFMQEASLYAAPEMEVIAVLAENGFGVSAGIADAEIKDYEEEF